MANFLYSKAKEEFLSGGLNLTSDTIKVVLVDTNDHTAVASHTGLNNVASAARIATSPALANKSVTNGVFDADNVVFTGVNGDESEAIIIYKDTGTESTSRLIAYIDSVDGLPITPNSGDIIIQWSDGASKIFAL